MTPTTPMTSVCMATFNGAAWVAEQIASILAQLGPDDELVVVDDGSMDATVATVRAIADPRIRLHENATNVGYVRSFERALSLATGEHVFLSDQDDVWPSGRVDTMRRALTSGAVVTGNIALLDGPAMIRGPFGERDWRVSSATSSHTLRNLLRLAASDAPYFGSAMAIRRDLLDLALPFPAPVRELHDAWLALLALSTRSMVHIDERVVMRREHGANASGTIRSPLRVARGRLFFVGMAVAAWYRPRISRRAAPARLRRGFPG
jgi:glycosyltransferase involved in cell wall biosynthesis